MAKLRRLSSFTSKQPQDSVVTTDGWLYKMKRSSQVISLSDWNKRYFTIEGDYLCWRHDKGGSPSGSVKISDIKSIKSIKQNKTAFVVKAGERTLYLRSESASDADRWVRSIQLQVDLRTGGTSQGPKGAKNHRTTNGGGDKYEFMIREVERSLQVLEKLDKDIGVSPSTSSRGKKDGGRGTTSASSADAWGGRLDFQNDKSILEPISP
eukprot:CAMPEP_0197553046 /NCGR_PEP_ID=MMETSP1320-20131121/8000_1 /TAXON_ID=91990 /ORGANISM="Bolidomonas sp., Strain RCC2347" /LENGTH=208 /DNA_ID=CAMNT_0043113759 /DNA_START=128 /DNA_END=751 /DNA_ORIENTATION=-